MRDLPELNLNLLLSLDALLAEANVTRAARRLGVTQPTMSRALRRLRDDLGPHVQRIDNSAGILGGIRLWDQSPDV